MTEGLIEGVVLTFGTVATVRDSPDGPTYRELIHPTALRGFDPTRVLLTFGNGTRARAVGRGVAAELSDRELAMTFRVASTLAGEEAMVLARDGILGDFGVGFQPIAERTRSDRVIERLAIDIDRVALVERGAFAGTGVRVARAAAQDEVDRLERAVAIDHARAIHDAEVFRRRLSQFLHAQP